MWRRECNLIRIWRRGRDGEDAVLTHENREGYYPTMRGGFVPRSIRRPMIAAALLVTLSAIAAPLFAWKPIVHVYLAMIARGDALDDGFITIEEADYERGRFALDASGRRRVIGRYAVDPAVLDALRRYPLQFKAGAIGPDTYPDVLTAQAGIHPNNSARGHGLSDDWLKLVWNEARKLPSRQAWAFAAGFMTHAAGDLFGHSFINNYAGGSFALGENALKHVVLESYIDKRTPTGAPGFFDTSIEGVEDFLYRQLVIGPLIPAGSARDIADHPKYFFNYAPPRLFLNLAGFVRAMKDACSADIDRCSRAIDAKLREANACKLSDPPRVPALTAEAAALKADKTVLQIVNAYFKAWQRDVEDGQKAWAPFGHEFGKAALFNAGGFDGDRLKSLSQEFVNRHLLSMLGTPDVIGENLEAIRRAREYIDRYVPEWFKDAVHFWRTDFEIWLLEQAWGVAWDYIKRPEVHFDPVMNNRLTDNKGERITLRDFNRNVLGIADDAFSTRDVYDWTRVPAMANSVTMMKLCLIGREGIGRLISDLEEKGYTSNGFVPQLTAAADEVPVGLGFHGSFDESDQWCRDRKMLFARDGCAYRKLFLRQIGEHAPPCFEACGAPADGSVTQAPFVRPLATGTSHPLSAATQAGGTIRLWGDVQDNGITRERPGDAPLVVRDGAAAPTAAVGVGGDAILSLAGDGTVWAWGQGARSLFGSLSTPGPLAPVKVPNLERITMIAAGIEHAVALRSNGVVWSWGSSDMEGQLGQGPGYHSHQPPRRVRGIEGIVAVGAGWTHSLAVNQAGEVWLWGYIGAGPKRNRNLAEKVSGLSGVTAVDGGYAHSLALKKDGTVWAWGWNKFRQLGDGTSLDRTEPVRVKGLDGVVAVAAGHHFSAALKSDGSVWVWGSNDPRILGITPGPNSLPTPTKVPNIPPMVELDAGQAHIVTMDKSGTVWEWGHNWLQPKKYAN